MNELELPPSALPVCAICVQSFVPGPRMLFEEVGWVEDRGGQGGTHHLLDRRRTGRVACPTCAERIRAGANPRQESLV